jgi:hypothetical protein
VAIAYHRVLFGGETFVLVDSLAFTLPSREFLSAALGAGHLPEWTDRLGLGSPYAANPVHNALYLPTWILAALPPSLGSDVLSVAHLALAAFGVSLFAKRLGADAGGRIVSGALYALGGYATTVVPDAQALTICWLPWVAWAADRLALAPSRFAAWWPAALVLAGCYALQIFMGEPAHIVTATLVAGLVALVRARRPGLALIRVTAAIAVAVPLAAVVLLPGRALLQWTSRAGGFSSRNTVWSLHPLRLVELVWPEVLGARNDAFRDLAGIVASSARGIMKGPSFSRSLYLGVPAVLLACAGAGRSRRHRRLLAASLVFIVLALGDFTPAEIVLRVLPGTSWARYPEKYVIGALLILAALAGAGFRRIFGRGHERGPLLRNAVVMAVAAMALLVAIGEAFQGTIVAAFEVAAPPRSSYDVPGAVAVALRSGLIAWCGTVLFAVTWLAARRIRGAGVVAAGVVAALLIWHAQRLTWTAPRALLADSPRILATLVAPERSGAPPRRITLLPGVTTLRRENAHDAASLARFLHEHLFDNTPSRFGLDVFPSHEGVRSMAQVAFERSVERTGARPVIDRLCWVLGLEYAVAPSGAAASYGMPVVARTDELALLACPTRPRAFVAPRSTWAPPDQISRSVALTAVGALPLDAGHVWLTAYAAIAAQSGSDEPARPCAATTDRPERVRLECVASSPSYAVLLDQMAPGWEARVDGRPAAIQVADGLFRAVAIGPGSHIVEFTYEAPWLRAGAMLSAASWAAVGAALAWQWRCRRAATAQRAARERRRAAAGDSP